VSSFEVSEARRRTDLDDRFGPDVLLWTHCTTAREYLRQGLIRSSGYHVVTCVVLLFWSAIGGPSPVTFVSTTLFSRHDELTGLAISSGGTLSLPLFSPLSSCLSSPLLHFLPKRRHHSQSLPPHRPIQLFSTFFSHVGSLTNMYTSSDRSSCF
jgi:hypothetical protein